MPIVLDSVAAIKALIDQPPVSSDPIMIDQLIINHFAQVTRDHQWIHIDTERAAAESPHKSTIAHGLLTLSLIPAWYERCFVFSNCKLELNYGFDKIRFLAPVLCGSEIAGSFLLTRADPSNASYLKLFWHVEVRIKRSEQLAMIATWITQQNLLAPS